MKDKKIDSIPDFKLCPPAPDPDKPKCTLSNEDLYNSIEELIQRLTTSGGRSWSLSVPVNYNKDPDMLFSELNRRFINFQEQLRLRDAELESARSFTKEIDLKNQQIIEELKIINKKLILKLK